MKYGAVLRAKVHAEALGLNPLENGEEEGQYFRSLLKKNYTQETNSIALQSNPKKLCLLETLVCVPDGPGCA